MGYNSNILNRSVFSNKPSQYLSFEFGIENRYSAIFDPISAIQWKSCEKIMMNNDFLGKNLYAVGQDKLSSTNVFVFIDANVFKFEHLFAFKVKKLFK